VDRWAWNLPRLVLLALAALWALQRAILLLGTRAKFLCPQALQMLAQVVPFRLPLAQADQDQVELCLSLPEQA
jgi:hypothetical protein